MAANLSTAYKNIKINPLNHNLLSTKISMKLKTFILLPLGLSSAFAQIVYQDNFDEDGLTTNLGTGGSGVAEQFNTTGSFIWNDDEDGDDGLSSGPSGGGAQITTFRTESSFRVSDGFVLEVTFDLDSNTGSAGVAPFPPNHLSFGLTSDPLDGINALFDNNNTVPITDGLGFSLGIRNGSVDEGIIEWDADGNAGAGLTSTLNNITFATGSGQTLTLDVAADGTYSYTYGAITGNGTTAINLDETYFFKARTQGSSAVAIQSITLSTASEQFVAPTISTSAEVFDLTASTIDFNISFDSTATSATLTTPLGEEDLLLLDAADGTADGQAVFSLIPSTVPLGLTNLEVSASRPGVAPLTEDIEIIIIDQDAGAPNNAFSTAIINDSPLFYYRFEEEAGATVIQDYSGNAFHTNAIRGNIAFGTSPGGMQNAADFSALTGGAKGITVPATSQLNQDFSFVCVLNVREAIPGNTRRLLSISPGDDGSGSSILGRQDQFRTFLNGGETNLTAPGVLPPTISCLVHFVFTADPDNGGGSMAVYLNGELNSTTLLATVPVNEGNWIIGASEIVGDPSWLDWIDETAIFEEVLTQEQITAHTSAFFTAADSFLGFDTDVTAIDLDAGETSVVLQWKTSDQATNVTINGEAVDGITQGGAFVQTFSPTVTTEYIIEVTEPDGTVLTESIEVIVTGTPINIPIIITSFEVDSSVSPPNVSIEFIGAVDTDYQIISSEDLISFPAAAASTTTNSDGVGTATFSGAAAPVTRQFYRIQEGADS